MNNTRIFYFLFFGFVFGVFITSFFAFPFYIKYFLSLIAFVSVVSSFFIKKRRLFLLYFAILILAFAFGLWRMEIKDKSLPGPDFILNKFLASKVIIVGEIFDEPASKEYGFQSVVKMQSIRLDPGARHYLLRDKPEYQEIKVNEKVLVGSGAFPKVKYGDTVSVWGKLERPENFETDSGRDFDYISHLAKDEVFYRTSFANIEVLSTGGGSYLKRILFKFKSSFIKNINLLIKEPESSLLVGLLLGSKSSLGIAWQERFAQAGLSHIVALSGYNITIVAEGIMAVLSFLPRAVSLFCGAFGIILFAILTGGSATVMRASIMALFVLLAKATARTYDVVRALFLAALFMIIHNPKILVFDLSFQLSFLSTLALIFISPIIEKKFLFIPEKYKIREIILATVSTQIFVLPFIIYKMGLVSFTALPANLLVLPVIPAIMLLGFLAGVISFVSFALAWPLAFISSWVLSYMLAIIKFFAELSFSFAQIKNFPLWALVLSYIIWGIIIWRSKIIFQRPTSLS